MKTKYIIAAHIILLLSAAALEANAGMFLDLDVGTTVTDYISTDCVPSGRWKSTSDAIHIECKDGRYLGDSGTLGKVRIGYQTNTRKWGPINIGAHAYFEHISDWRMGDGGLDGIWAGIRIE